MATATNNSAPNAGVSPNATGVSKELTITLDEFVSAKLIALVKYANKDRIALHGVVSVEKEILNLSQEFLADKIASFHKALTNQIKDRKDKDTSAYFRLLVAKGEPVDKAYKMAYGE